MEKLKSLLARMGVARLAEFVGIETLENMERWFRVRVTSPALVEILIQRYGSTLLANAKIRSSVVDQLEEFDRNYVLGGSKRVTWSDRSATAKRLVQTLGVSDDFLPRQKEEKSPAVSIIDPDAPLHDYQVNVKAKVLEVLYAPSSRALMHMPTGAGKTRTACEAMVDLLRAEPPGPAIFVWLAHSEELCVQAVESIEKSWAEKGDHPVAITRLWGSFEKPSEIPARGFVVASFQTVHALLTSTSRDLSLLTAISRANKLIVVDEAHKAIATTYDIAINTLSMASTPPRILGLTATPGRGEDEEENLRLSKFFNDTKVSLCDDQGEPLEDGIAYLQGLGVLARLKRERIETNLTIDLTEEEIRKLSELMELPAGFLKRLGGQHERNLLIFNRIMELHDAGNQVIIFACSVAHAELISDLCVARNIPARLITGGTEASDRARWIAEYKRSEVRIIINYGVLTTGFDAPNTDTVFITRPTASVVLYSQMIGRAIRGVKNGGNETATIIDVVDNLIGMPSENMAYNYFNDIWRA